MIVCRPTGVNKKKKFLSGRFFGDQAPLSVHLRKLVLGDEPPTRVVAARGPTTALYLQGELRFSVRLPAAAAGIPAQRFYAGPVPAVRQQQRWFSAVERPGAV